jgi:hypothetical protein
MEIFFSPLFSLLDGFSMLDGEYLDNANFVAALSLVGFILLNFIDSVPKVLMDAVAPVIGSGQLFYGLLAALFTIGYFVTHPEKKLAKKGNEWQHVFMSIVGAALLVMGAVSLTPQHLEDQWGTRTDPVSKVVAYICQFGLISSGLHMMIDKSTNKDLFNGLSKHLFGWSLMAIAVFFSIPQSFRNSFYAFGK